MISIRSLFAAVVVATLALSGALAQDMPTMKQHQQTKIQIATHAQLNDATALANKNMLASANNIAIARSNVVAQQNDAVDITEADELPPGLTLTGQKDTLAPPTGAPTAATATKEFYGGGGYGGGYGYRRRFFHRGFHGGYYGWSYPLSYWNLYGRGFYGGACPYGQIYGGYYYC